MPELLDTLLDVFLDAFQDTLTLIPFLFITYLAMEALEHSAAHFSERVVVRAGKAGPVLGSLLGALPQCGFSAMAATLYAGRVVTVGTVFAVFLSTSDEMLPVFISEGAPIETILTIIGLKVLIGMLAGLLVDACIRLVRGNRRDKLRIHELCLQDNCDCESIEDDVHDAVSGTEGNSGEHLKGDASSYPTPEKVSGGTSHENHTAQRRAVEAAALAAYKDDGFASHSEKGNPEHESGSVQESKNDHACAHCTCSHHHYGASHGHGHAHGHGSIWRSALIHTVQVTLFIFLISLILDGIITFVGEDVLANFMNQNAILSIFASGLVGLIPNCAASVAISDLYLQGALGTPAMMAGLLVGAGVGLLVLFRSNRPQRNNVVILSVLYAIGVAIGLVLYAIGFAI